MLPSIYRRPNLRRDVETPLSEIELRNQRSLILANQEFVSRTLFIERLNEMSATLDRATQSLERLTNASTAVGNVIDMLVAEIRATNTDDPKVLAALDAIDAKADEIVAKALVNTPAAPRGPADRGPEPEAPV